MPTIVINLLLDGGMPVDKYEENEEGKSCPLPTQDPELNDENRQTAIEEYHYRGPNEGSAFRLTNVCGNCGMYNQTEEILECLGDESGNTGYCQLLKFACKSENTCDEWVEGGPITSESQETYRDIL